MFRVEDRSNGEFIGRAGNRPEAGTEQVEIAYALRSDRWGYGLGTELARALWEHAARSSLTALVGDVLPENIASQRILQRLGMSFVKEHRYTDGLMVRRFEGRPAVPRLRRASARDQSSQMPQLTQTRAATRRHNEVVEQLEPEQLRRRGELPRDLQVLCAGGAVTRGMVVHQD
jgi:hypothetical protein